MEKIEIIIILTTLNILELFGMNQLPSFLSNLSSKGYEHKDEMCPVLNNGRFIPGDLLFDLIQKDENIQKYCVCVHLLSEENDELLKKIYLPEFILYIVDPIYYGIYKSGKFSDEHFSYVLTNYENAEDFIDVMFDVLNFKCSKDSVKKLSFKNDNDFCKYVSSTRFDGFKYSIDFRGLMNNLEKVDSLLPENIISNIFDEYGHKIKNHLIPDISYENIVLAHHYLKIDPSTIDKFLFLFDSKKSMSGSNFEKSDVTWTIKNGIPMYGEHYVELKRYTDSNKIAIYINEDQCIKKLKLYEFFREYLTEKDADLVTTNLIDFLSIIPTKEFFDSYNKICKKINEIFPKLKQEKKIFVEYETRKIFKIK
ncbi:hypothetical protein Catovirus_1_219 [Catovirus CTV1]|uniref:Uncharacterized protein n=1 Tax=Catovirus CTV1 TaxID=1977631 RepID=A0A1V0S8Y5_9VIRU|nr:hypothetical protein Catovirus_1_219 [Catovirus CTV1]